MFNTENYSTCIDENTHVLRISSANLLPYRLRKPSSPHRTTHHCRCPEQVVWSYKVRSGSVSATMPGLPCTRPVCRVPHISGRRCPQRRWGSAWWSQGPPRVGVTPLSHGMHSEAMGGSMDSCQPSAWSARSAPSDASSLVHVDAGCSPSASTLRGGRSLIPRQYLHLTA